ncbi:hypothetical protein KIW84_063402 [Lathyrus oleraceus]|uniref:Uncharacterized protein n=1 Tax=Pisum sativum TaxID=3888 RepID=A0A9D5A7P4_PEA|nr:hypothetical protein KIW84_063402 [Pisum sativum]
MNLKFKSDEIIIDDDGDEATVYGDNGRRGDNVIHTLNNLGPEYKEILTALHTRENPIGFEELHDLLQDYETYLTRDDVAPPITSSNPAYKDKPKFTKHGHPPKILMISLKHQPISIIPEDYHLEIL